jgi:hypothetical protein
MFRIEQSHGLKHIIDVFDRYGWKFQYEKRKEIHDCLKTLMHLDHHVKHLRINHPEVLKLYYFNHSRFRHDFMKSACKIIQKIVLLMEEEDQDITVLNEEFQNHSLSEDEILVEKNAIESEDAQEERYAKKLEAWADKMITVTKIIYKKHHLDDLKQFLVHLKNIKKDMRWFESSVEKEEKIIEKSKGAVKI